MSGPTLILAQAETTVTIWSFLPAMSAALVICFTLFGLAGRIGVLIAAAKADVQGLKEDLHEIKPKVDLILSVQQQQLADGKRIDRIETRLDVMAGGGKA